MTFLVPSATSPKLNIFKKDSEKARRIAICTINMRIKSDRHSQEAVNLWILMFPSPRGKNCKVESRDVYGSTNTSARAFSAAIHVLSSTTLILMLTQVYRKKDTRSSFTTLSILLPPRRQLGCLLKTSAFQTIYFYRSTGYNSKHRRPRKDPCRNMSRVEINGVKTQKQNSIFLNDHGDAVGTRRDSGGLRRSQWCEPARRCLCQWAAVARQHQAENRRTGAQRRTTMRHLADPSSLQRLCLQDTWQLHQKNSQRNNKQKLKILRDGIDPTPGNRRFETSSCNGRSRRADFHVQARVSVDIRMGNQGSIASRRSMHQRQHTEPPPPPSSSARVGSHNRINVGVRPCKKMDDALSLLSHLIVGAPSARWPRIRVHNNCYASSVTFLASETKRIHLMFLTHVEFTKWQLDVLNSRIFLPCPNIGECNPISRIFTKPLRKFYSVTKADVVETEGTVSQRILTEGNKVHRAGYRVLHAESLRRTYEMAPLWFRQSSLKKFTPISFEVNGSIVSVLKSRIETELQKNVYLHTFTKNHFANKCLCARLSVCEMSFVRLENAISRLKYRRRGNQVSCFCKSTHKIYPGWLFNTCELDQYTAVKEIKTNSFHV
ncbi:unnamed protein product, partial [Nesidiocoris tenuis]